MKWNIDVTHSQAEFAVKHLMISTVRGRFKTISGFGQSDAGGTLTNVSLDIDVASIDTNQQQRDDHLRRPLHADADPLIGSGTARDQRLRQTVGIGLAFVEQRIEAGGEHEGWR